MFRSFVTASYTLGLVACVVVEIISGKKKKHIMDKIRKNSVYVGVKLKGSFRKSKSWKRPILKRTLLFGSTLLFTDAKTEAELDDMCKSTKLVIRT